MPPSPPLVRVLIQGLAPTLSASFSAGLAGGCGGPVPPESAAMAGPSGEDAPARLIPEAEGGSGASTIPEVQGPEAEGPPGPPPPPPIPPPVGNPPPPPPPEIELSRNPPPPRVPPPIPGEAPLPTWDEVPSTHPKGATNPPRPVLVVLQDGTRCWKEWVSPMLPPGPLEPALGGKIVAEAPDHLVEIQCPVERVQAILRAKAPPR